MFTKWLRRNLLSLKNDRKGNFALYGALAAPILLMGSGLALDISNMTALKTRFQAASDSVSLAVASRIANGDLEVSNAKTFAKTLLNAQMEGERSRFLNLEITPEINIKETVTPSGNSWEVEVGGTASQNVTPFSALFGNDRLGVTLTSRSITGTDVVLGALSIALVVDVSGSMDLKDKTGVKKINALKQASASLFTELNNADKEKKYVRAGAVSFSERIINKSKMRWGTWGAANLIGSQYSMGGTSSSAAVEWAYKQLKPKDNKKDKEAKAHKKKNGQEPDRYLLFLTDGDNNYYEDDSKTLQHCSTAKSKGIVIYSIAFAAPSRGRSLLKSCATSEDHYFDPTTASQLISTFKKIGVASSKSLTRLTQ